MMRHIATGAVYAAVLSVTNAMDRVVNIRGDSE